MKVKYEKMEFVNTIILAFFEGIALIISPCILPILPIILSGSLPNLDKFRPLGVVLGFILSFTFFTFFSRKLVQLSGIDLDLIRYGSYLLLTLFALIMLSEYLTARFEWLTQRLASVNTARSNFSRFELMNGMAFGCLVGIIWTPCAGPILAAVILQTVLQQSDWMGFLVVLAFGVGAGLPMLIIALTGNQLIAKLQFLKRHGVLIRKVLGLIILLSVGYLLLGNPMPETFNRSEPIHQNRLVDGLYRPYPAPAITGITQWFNSTPLQLSDLKGKVVLVDFWAYSCINCLRTLPYLKAWYEKYRSQGLVIIGVHTPEFPFESKALNVENAVKKLGILYPVAMDNGYVTWRNFNNRYWPAHYLIDPQGKVVYTHFGEGNYGITENNIRFLLGLNKPEEGYAKEPTVSILRTPETYLGYERIQNFASPQPITKNQPQRYQYPNTLSTNAWALQGEWTIEAQHITAQQSGASIKLHFQGKRVFSVMGSTSGKPIKIRVLLDGKPVKDHPELDLHQGVLEVKQHELYRLIYLDDRDKGVLELITEQAGLEMYTFTFG